MRKTGQEQRGLWRSCRQKARWRVCRERELAATCCVFSVDAKHMAALSGTSGNSLEIISTRFGTLRNCWVY